MSTISRDELRGLIEKAQELAYEESEHEDTLFDVRYYENEPAHLQWRVVAHEEMDGGVVVVEAPRPGVPPEEYMPDERGDLYVG